MHLILPPRHSNDTQRLWRAATAKGWRTTRMRGWRIDTRPKGPVTLYGEPLFVATLAQQLHITPLEPPLDWLADVPVDAVGREIFATTLGALTLSDVPRFIKPADDKCFPASIFAPGDPLPDAALLGPGTPVLVSEIRTFLNEYRAFVLDGHVTTISRYAVNGDVDVAPADDEEGARALAFTARVLELVDVPPAVVIDVGRTEEAGWALIESNPCWGSGIYDCDPDAVLDVLARACVPSDALSDEERRWVVPRAVEL